MFITSIDAHLNLSNHLRPVKQSPRSHPLIEAAYIPWLINHTTEKDHACFKAIGCMVQCNVTASIPRHAIGAAASTDKP